MQHTDGTVIPSYLGSSVRGNSTSQDLLMNYVLRVGEVRKIVLPNEDMSFSKHVVEYEVEVQVREGTGNTSTSTYRGVIANNVFGGGADSVDVTYRADPTPQKDGVGKGSRVLLLCVSGDTNKAIILGGAPDAGLSAANQDLGHHFRWVFNGITFNVNKDGEASLEFNGATQIDGQPEDNNVKGAAGAKLLVDKNGSITVSTSDNNQSVKIDHANKTIEIKADSKWHATVSGDLKFEVQKNIEFLSSAGECTIAVANKTKIKSSGLLVGVANEAFVKGSTYRQNEAIMNSTLSSTYASIAGLMSTAGGSLMVAAPLNAIPMVGGLLAAPGLIASATALAALAPLFATAASAISGFESGSATYISLLNFGD